MLVAKFHPLSFKRPWLALSYLLTAWSALFFASGCSDSPPSQPSPTYSMKVIELDSIWILDSPQLVLMVVQAYPAEWAAGRTLRCLINGNGVSTHFQLYDDGSELIHPDGQGFCDVVSGDIVAGDGKFARRLNSLFTTRAGEYKMSIAFLDQNPGVDTLYASIIVASDSPPVIEWESYPDSMISGSEPPVMETRVRDLDGNDDIAVVQIARSRVPRGSPSRTAYDMAPISDSIYQWALPPEFAAGYPSGSHEFYGRTADWAMREHDNYSFTDTISIWMGNAPPQIDSISAPDTVWVSGGAADSTKFYIDLFLHDDQTPLDLDSLLLSVSRYDSASQRDVVTFTAFYFDNGRGNDSLTSAGMIRTGFSANRQNRLMTPFTFAWTPVDRSPQRGRSAENVIVIMLSGNGVPPRDGFEAAGTGIHPDPF